MVSFQTCNAENKEMNSWKKYRHTKGHKLRARQEKTKLNSVMSKTTWWCSRVYMEKVKTEKCKGEKVGGRC